MCVICYIPKKAKELSELDLLYMWQANPHGAGIMWLENDKSVHFVKGYFDFDSFYRDYLIIKRDYNFECALHFRIATAGGINREMCHPFTLTNNDDTILKLEGNCDVAVMHNGIIDISNRPNFSDTAEYIINNLYPRYYKDNRFFLHLNNKELVNIVNEIGYSKLLFFSKDGIKMIGDWEKYKGCYCSNLYFDNRYYRYYN